MKNGIGRGYCCERWCRNLRRKDRRRCYTCDSRRKRKKHPMRAAFRALKDHAVARGIIFRLSVTADFQSSIDILPASEFPPAIPMENAKVIKVEATEFIKPLQMVKHAMADDAAGNYGLTGINIATRKSSDLLSFAATNHNRIAVFNSSIKSASVDVIVPSTVVEAIIKNAEGSITVEISEGAIQVTGENTRITSRLLEAKFPSYSQVMPEPTNSVFTCVAAELLGAIRKAALFLDVQQFALTLTGKNKHLELSCEGKATARIMGSELQGQPKFAIKFNHRFMADVLGVLDKDEVRIECDDPNNARVIREGDFIAVLAPIRVATS